MPAASPARAPWAFPPASPISPPAWPSWFPGTVPTWLCSRRLFKASTRARSSSGRGVEIAEYSPAEVKSAVTGNGRADKVQVARMVKLLLGPSAAGSLSADASDALALALCCAQRFRLDQLRTQR